MAEERSKLEIRSFDDLRRVLMLAQGGNPDAQQTLNDFINFKSKTEKTNLPTRLDVQRQTYLNYAGAVLFPDDPHDPFTLLGEALATSFMAKGGEKSKQFVELMKQTPSIADIQSITGASQDRGMVDKLLGRGKE